MCFNATATIYTQNYNFSVSKHMYLWILTVAYFKAITNLCYTRNSKYISWSTACFTQILT